MYVVHRCVGLDCQVLDSGGRKFNKLATAVSTYYTSYGANGRDLNIQKATRNGTGGAQVTANATHKDRNGISKATTGAQGKEDGLDAQSKNIVLVLTNLAVAADRRKEGVATQLLNTCEQYAKVCT